MNIFKMTSLIISTVVAILVLLLLFSVISTLTLSTKPVMSIVNIDASGYDVELLTTMTTYFAPAHFFDEQGNFDSTYEAEYQSLQEDKAKFGACASWYPYYSANKKDGVWELSENVTESIFGSLVNPGRRHLPLFLAIKAQATDDKRETVAIVKVTKSKAEVVQLCGDNSDISLTLRSITAIDGAGWNVHLSLNTK